MFMQASRRLADEIRTQRACRRRSTPTFLFADLVGYTALTEAMGDGVMIWIADAGDAVSLAAQALTGPAVQRGSDCGSAVNVAARLADQARPNEALVSEATWALARCEFTKPVDKPRELVLRGLDRRVAAWRLA
jgi:class 3 adenylate cyclase